MGQSGALADFAVALLPIAVLIVLLLVFKLKAAVASLAGLAAAVLAGVLYFGRPWANLPIEAARGAWNALSIFIVIFPAMLIYQASSEANMFAHIKQRVDGMIRDELLRVLFIGWAFASFLQSVTGFGVPVAVCAPILTGFGFSPVTAVIISILGHAWGGTFGTLAIAWDSMMMQANLGEAALVTRTAVNTGLMLWLDITVCGFVIYGLYKRHKGDKRVRARELIYIVTISAVQGGGQLLTARLNPSVACFVASALSMAAVFLLDWLAAGKKRRAVPAGEEGKKKDAVPLWDILFPYAVLVALVAVLLLVGPVNAFLSRFKVGFRLLSAANDGSLYSPLSVFTHSGTILLMASLLLYTRYLRRGYVKLANVGAALQKALKKSGQSILPILCLIVMSKVMDGTGQIAVLAAGTAGALGAAYPIAAPFIGVLGSFICSSNMSSNILFTGFQSNIAASLQMNPGVILAAQTAGGSVGNLLAASNIVLGLITTRAAGWESKVLKFLLPVALAIGLVCGILTLILV